MRRRSFLAGTAALPALPAAAAAPAPGVAERARLLALIVELENAPGYEACSIHWTKAHIAGQMREALGIEVPDCPNRRDYLVWSERVRREAEVWMRNWTR